MLADCVAKDPAWTQKLENELIPVREILTMQLDSVVELERRAKIDQGVQVVALIDAANKPVELLY